MVYGAIDLHMRFSQIRIVDETGRVVRDRRVVTSRDRLVAAFAGVGPIRILLETGPDSEWVAQQLEAAGYAVVVADPHYAPMYGDLQRKVKTDRRDAAALAEANRRGWYRAAHRTSAPQRATRQRLRTRRQLVQARSGAVALIRSLVTQDGDRLPSCSAARVPARLAQLAVAPGLATTVAPLARLIETTTQEIAALDQRLAAVAMSDAVVQQLQTVPGVGLIVALTFRSQLDDLHRFTHAGQVSARDWSGAARGQLGGAAAARAHNQSRAARAAQPAGAGGMGVLAEPAERDPPCVGGATGRAARPPHRGRRPGTATESDSVCHLARRVGI
jgi:transposase